MRDRIRALLDPETELWELGMTAGKSTNLESQLIFCTGLGLEYGDVPCGGCVTGVRKFDFRIRKFKLESLKLRLARYTGWTP